MFNIFKSLKRRSVKKKFLFFGKNSSISDGIKGHLKNVSIGDHCFLGENVSFNSLNAKVSIGNHVIIASDVLFITGNHRYDVLGKYISEIGEEEKRQSDDQDIVVADDVWIGSRAILLKGVSIGEGSIIGAGAVVTKTVEPYSIVAGNPAKLIKMRFNSEEIKKHKAILEEARKQQG